MLCELIFIIFFIIVCYYKEVRSKASGMMRGLDSFVGGISVAVDYSSPRAVNFLNDLYGAVSAAAHYALSLAGANTKFKLSKDGIKAIFDDNGYDGNYLLSLPKKQTVTVIRLAVLQSLKEEKLASDSCLTDYNEFREEAIRKDLTGFAAEAMSVISCVSSNKLPFAYVQLITFFTRIFLLFAIFLSYVAFSLEHSIENHSFHYQCYSSIFSRRGELINCSTEEYLFFNVFNLSITYFILGLLELYPTLIKSWQSQLVLKNYRGVIDLICEPLKPDVYNKPKNLSQLKLKKGAEEKMCGKIADMDAMGKGSPADDDDVYSEGPDDDGGRRSMDE